MPKVSARLVEEDEHVGRVIERGHLFVVQRAEEVRAVGDSVCLSLCTQTGLKWPTAGDERLHFGWQAGERRQQHMNALVVAQPADKQHQRAMAEARAPSCCARLCLGAAREAGEVDPEMHYATLLGVGA